MEEKELKAQASSSDFGKCKRAGKAATVERKGRERESKTLGWEGWRGKVRNSLNYKRK